MIPFDPIPNMRPVDNNDDLHMNFIEEPTYEPSCRKPKLFPTKIKFKKRDKCVKGRRKEGC